MCSGRGYRKTLYGLYMIWKFYELHVATIDWEFGDDFSHWKDYFDLAIFFYYCDLSFAGERKIRAERMKEVKVDLFFLFLHLKITILRL